MAEPWAEFQTRVKRPPDNPVNALISFTNSLCYTLCLSEIYRTAFNPTISVLHQPGHRRFSLALHLAEIFKPAIVDRLIFRLINNGEIAPKHFDKTLNFCHLNKALLYLACDILTWNKSLLGTGFIDNRAPAAQKWRDSLAKGAKFDSLHHMNETLLYVLIPTKEAFLQRALFIYSLCSPFMVSNPQPQDLKNLIERQQLMDKNTYPAPENPPVVKIGQDSGDYQLMVDSVRDYAIILLDASGHVASWNPGAERFKGYKAEEIIGQHFSRFYPLEALERGFPDEELRLAAQEGRFEDEGWRVRQDGSQFWANVVITALRDKAGNLRGFAKLTRDLTERKQAEEELRAAKEAAEEGSIAKSQFLANMSHEIRTPMNGVLGPIGLLLDSKLSRQQRELTEIARSSAETLLGIINDILDLSKIEVGRLDIEPIPFNLLMAIEETAGMMAARAEEKGLDLIVRYPPTVPRHVIGDPGRIRQVLANLISNAIKFTAQGHVLIDIEAELQSETDVALRICVQDSGIGIAPEKIGHVFGRFNQADTSTTRRYGGTGLGLSISQQLVELMGGEIGATSVVGEGSTFSFTLRLPLQGDAPTFTLPDADLSGVRILIVDDNAVNRRVLHEQLNNWNLRNESSQGSYEALDALRAAHAAGDPFQIAILDHQMPDMDGESLGHAIKADPLLHDTVLVMLTSLGNQGDASRLKAAGFAAYLLKPARQSELLGTLVDVWAARNAEQSGELATRHGLTGENFGRKDAAGRWDGTRVLVVEDNIVNQKVATLILHSFGCRVEVAANGLEALKSIETLPFDIIFMDCEMPEMDGFEATAAIRLRPDAKRTLPIIAVTARATQGDRERCLQAGMDDYMSKPVKSEDFQAILEQWTPLATDEDQEKKGNGEEAPQASKVLPASRAHRSSLDAEVVARLRDLAAATDASLLGQIFESFISDGKARILTLHRALENADAVALHKASHALKGASANIGARRLAEIAEQLQTLGEENSLEGAATPVAEFEAEFGKVRAEIAAELEKAL